ncbi:type I polyketide synthase [Actinocrispum sp. NPDC049592]|uniref:type I polyketide synthase n=1 Tax=Actinocrispum sp. NPDC049592 TaxID=3154835 RepID=UPI003414ABF5
MSDVPADRLVAALRKSMRDNERLRGQTTRLLAEPIAIVAMSCRFPGGVSSPEDLWQLVADGRDAITPFPADRGWDPDLHDPRPGRPGRTYARAGGFLHDAAMFDAEFFGISPKEAALMDPQQRLLLETSWEAVERAGINPVSLRGSDTGVFAGLMYHDYAGGSAGSIVSGRVAYALGLQGPTLTVDTACSSSLVALHLACQALRRGECSMALAAGVAVMATPQMLIDFGEQRGLSPDGRCKSFSATADGTGWAEGVGVLLIERLSDAQFRGHPVVAVIRGSAINQDGASSGLMTPNGTAQQQVIRTALENAKLSAADIDVIEAHGTGTPLGDPIEAHALRETYGRGRKRPLWLGSVKSNIGHTQAAAGMAGIIKMVQAIQHGILPKTLHADSPSSKMDWSSLRLLTEAMPWDRTCRRAGVSSFGLSGTNAHVIIEQAPVVPLESRGLAVPVVPLVVCGKTADAVRAQATRLLSYLDTEPTDLGYSLASGRARFAHRAVVLGSAVEDLEHGLAELGRAERAPGLIVGTGRIHGLTAFLFGGQARVGIGQELYDGYPAFAQAYDEVMRYPDVSELFAVEVALFRLLESWGIKPDYVAGHGDGEVAAAHAAGVLSLEDACALAADREIAATLNFAAPSIPVVSTVTGAAADIDDPDYWTRPADRLTDAIEYLASLGVSRFLELGQTGDLTELAQQSVEYAVHACGLRGSESEPMTLLTAVSRLFVAGMDVTWAAYFAGTAARRVDLPTYPFQRKRYWTLPPTTAVIGPEHTPIDHPILTTATPVGDSSVVLSGEISPDRQPWLTDHEVAGQVVVPGSAVVEMVLYAGMHVGCPAIDELTLRAPMTGGPVQVVVDAPHLDRRAVRVFAKSGGDWTLHAEGTLSSSAATGNDLREWPPDAALTDIADVYPALAAKGLTYGPMLQGLRSAWRRGDELFAEVELPDRMDAERHCIHPVLLDTAMHVSMVDAEDPAVPFVWKGVSLHAKGSAVARVRIGPNGLTLADAIGRPVLSVDSLITRALPADQTTAGPLFQTVWRPVPAGDAEPVDAVFECSLEGDVLAGARLVTEQVLHELQDWLREDRQSRLVIVTKDDLRHAPVRGLVRSAQAENPGQFVVVDTDGSGALAGAMATGEPELRIRAGKVLAPRLERVDGGETTVWSADDTVLITGGTTGVGLAIARHLVAEHGIRKLILTGRTSREVDVPGAVIVACDVSDREAVADLLATHAVTAIIHAAGVIDDGTVASLTPDRIGTTFAPKVDGAWHLHELAGEVSKFVLISSVAGVLGSAGQGNYAAANAFLDALATKRRADGLPAISLAFGRWDIGMGSGGFSVEQGVRLFDAAMTIDASTIVPARLGEVRTPIRQVRNADLTDDDILDVVRETVAGVLGYSDAAAVDPDKSFEQLGFDSLATIELRNRLSAATGLRLSATLPYDYPTVGDLADYIAGACDGQQARKSAGPGDDPIAIVAMSCRYPGGIGSSQDLWRMVAEGRDVMSTLPTDRGWPEDLYTSGRTATNIGGFLDGAGDFDADFFGISPREATEMDPQQRLLLEISWEAVERAGIDPGSLRGSSTGVFAGVMYHDYGGGTAGSVVSGRISHTLGLEGPAVTVDTACSSSLVALHLAAQALRGGECDLALAGGVTVMATPDNLVYFSGQRGLAPDGRCKSFAGAANGTGWAEGAGVVLLERLSDARRNGHPVLAIVRGSAMNQDGASNGLTAPNGPAQQRVIRQALASARLSPSDIDVVEAHGTGTTLGDPVEALALLATYGQGRAEPLWLGSIKSNMGHTQAAAGIAGVIKMVESMRHGTMPPTLHVDRPSPHVDWTTGNVRLLTQARPWDRPVRRAGISSFGLSGTNAHVIIEHVPAEQPLASPAVPMMPWILSGRTPAALSDQARRLKSYVEDNPGLDPADIGFSLLSTRTAFDHRAAVVGSDRSKLLRGLGLLVRGETGHAVVRGKNHAGRTAFLFTGQGAQRLGMGQQLHETYPAYAHAFDAVVFELDKGLDLPLKGVIWGGDEDLAGQTEFVQAGMFAVEVALFRLLESWGIRPDYLLGHSIGEIAAAHVAGVLSLVDACTLITARGRLMQSLPVGAMVAVQATEAEVVPLVTDKVSIAAVNGPNSLVLSGVEDVVVEIAARFAAQGRKTERLRVSHAFHSPLMDPMLDEFRAIAARLTYRAAEIPVVSTVTGGLAECRSSGYWVEHVRRPVRFADGIRFLEARGVTRFVELGPDAVLTWLAERSLESEAVLVALQRENRPEAIGLVTAIGQLYAAGMPVDWSAFFTGANRVDLPTYAFQHQRYWMLAKDPAPSGLDHPFLTTEVPSPDSAAVTFTGRLSIDAQPWLADHEINGEVLVPGSTFVEMVLWAGERTGSPGIDQLTMHTPLVLTDDRPVQVVLGEPVAGKRSVRVFSLWDEEWILHCEGTCGFAEPPREALEVPPEGAVELDVSDAYELLYDKGFAYGPAFQGLRAAWQLGDDLFAEVAVPERGFAIHPALIDAAMHAGLLAGDAEVPFEWHGVSLHAKDVTAVLVRMSGPAIELFSAGQPVLTVRSLATRPIKPGVPPPVDSVYQVGWLPIDPGGPAGPAEFFDIPSVHDSLPNSVREVLARTHSVIKEHLADGSGKLVIVTKNAMSTDDEEGADVRQAPVWGLVRAAEVENPGRFVLVDVDRTTESQAVLADAVATGEPELAIREGEILVPRLTKLPVEGERTWQGTVLITGGTGALGSAIARHLVTAHGVRSLVLASRRGIDAPGASGLRNELAKLGAVVRLADCDVSRKDELESLFADHMISAVVHLAGVAGNAMIESLTLEQIDAVLSAKADAAWHLHELTRDLDLDAFVMISSSSAVLPAAGQANYAAANMFLDALAAQRRAQGLPATSLAYGMWDIAAGMSASLTVADRERMRKSGLDPLPVPEALAMFDAAGEASVVPVRIDRAELRKRDQVPAVLRGMAQVPRMATGKLRERIAGMPADQRDRVVLDIVRAHVASVLGHPSGSAIDPERAFTQLGFDSAASVELRNQLTTATGLRLPATLTFDHPTAKAVTDLIVAGFTEPEQTLLSELDKLESVLEAAAVSQDEHAEVVRRLRSMAAKWVEPQDAVITREDIESATAEQIFEILDQDH